MQFPHEKSIDVVGVGNSLMDLLVEVDDAFLHEHGLIKGRMHLVDESEAEKYLQAVEEKHVKTLPGGGSANTTRGVALLGGSAAFFGAIGSGMYAKMYRDALKSQGVHARLREADTLTGNAITYITPDHERTFTVHLGAASLLRPEDIDEAVIANAKVVHLEAFQFEGGTLPVIETVVKYAKRHGTLVSLDLNDASLIKRNHKALCRFVSEHVDILFVNEDEALAFCGVGDEAAIEKLAPYAEVVILKLGKDGSRIAAGGEVIPIDIVPTEALDTTGAGDLYAAGFLYGLTRGWDAKRAGAIGSRFAAAVIAKIGVDLSNIDVRNFFAR